MERCKFEEGEKQILVADAAQEIIGWLL